MTSRRVATLLIGAVLLPLAALLACSVGSTAIPLADTWTALFTGGGDPDVRVVVRELRLPRVALAALVGAALSLSGAALQGLFRNPLADPYVLGISSGGALGAALALVFGQSTILGLGAPPLWAFIGAALAAAAVYRLALVGGTLPLDGLLLAGIAVGLTLSAAVSAVLIAARERAGDVLLWLMGHLGGTTWSEVAVVAGCTAVGAMMLGLLARELNALLMGEAVAASLGVAVERTKVLVMLACAVLVAGAVAFCGVIGFVGLVVPHAIRFATGADHRWLLPAAALLGASTLILADLGARTVVTGELPVGVLTGAVGGPFFILLLRRSLGRARG